MSLSIIPSHTTGDLSWGGDNVGYVKTFYAKSFKDVLAIVYEQVFNWNIDNFPFWKETKYFEMFHRIGVQAWFTSKKKWPSSTIVEHPS